MCNNLILQTCSLFVSNGLAFIRRSMAIIVALSACHTIFARIEFTGGPDGLSRDLSRSENWSGTPSSSELAAIDVGTFGGVFTVEADVAFSGVDFENGTSSQDITISGNGCMTIGAEGFSLLSDVARISLHANVRLVADQTWTLLDTPLDTFCTVDGQSEWAIVVGGADAVIRHLVPLCYGGHITYRGSDGGTVRYLAGTNWANRVTIATAVTSKSKCKDGQSPFPNILAVTNEVHWSQIFAGGELEILSDEAVHFVVCQPSAADVGSVGNPGRVIFEDGDVLIRRGSKRASRIEIAQGTIEQRGGNIEYDTVYQFRLSTASLYPCRGIVDYNGIAVSSQRWEVNGGSFTGSAIEFGEGTGPSSKSAIVQSGGTVDARVGIYVGSSSSSTKSLEDAVVEYALCGGLLTVGATGMNSGWDSYQSCGLLVAGAHRTDSNSSKVPSAVFTMSGGELRAKNIMFGPDFYSGNPTGFVATNSFGVFDMSAGTVKLCHDFSKSVKGEGFAVGSAWNRFCTNSHYRINLRGGRIETGGTDYSMDFGAYLPSSETSFIWDTGLGKTSFNAPISGDGTLVKEGSGELALTDATRFYGTLDVAEGKVTLPTEVGGSDQLGDCFRWCADDLRITYADGDTVVKWQDMAKGVSIVSNTYSGAEDWAGFACPTLAVDAGFNGHAALRFGQLSSLMLSDADNPLCGLATGTVVVVFRADDGKRSRFTRYAHQTGPLAMVPKWSADMQFKIFAANDQVDVNVEQGIGLHYLMSDSKTGTIDSLYDPIFSKPGVPIGTDVHVAIATISGEDFSLYADGYYSTAKHSAWNGGKTATGKERRLERSGLYLAGRITDGATKASFPCLIAELRIYPDKAFALDRQRELATLLYRTYRADCPSGWDGSYAGSLKLRTESVSEKPSGGLELAAAELNAFDAAAGCVKPVLVENAVNGKPAVRFDAAASTALSVPAVVSPITDAEEYSVAVVFRTTSDGSDDKSYFYNSPALVSSKQGRLYGDDFAMSFVADGAVAAAYGYRETDTSYWRSYAMTRKPCRLNDGLPHVAVLSCRPNADSNRLTLMVDGMVTTLSGGVKSSAKHGSFALTIGASCPNGPSDGFFTGDISVVNLYGRALDLSEMRSISEAYASEYGFRLLPTMPYGESALSAFGLNATNIIVREGACLEMPFGNASPFVVPCGSMLGGGGNMVGSYRFGHGATLDVSGEGFCAPEDVQMAGGTIRLAVGAPVAFKSFAASGTIRMDFVGDLCDAHLPRRLLLASFETAEVTDDVAWVSDALSNGQSIRYDAATRTLWLERRYGSTITIR